MSPPRVDSLGILSWWGGVLRFAFAGAAPKFPKEVPLWALCTPYRLWSDVVRHDGRTFRDLHQKGQGSLAKALLPLRAIYLVFLFAWPLVSLFRAALRGTGAARYFRAAMARPEMLAQYPHAEFDAADIAWSRPDYALAMYYAARFARGPHALFELDDKKVFLAACAKHALPTPPTLSAAEAVAQPGEYIVKLPKSDLGFGVEMVTDEELREVDNADRFVIQRRLKNHASLRAVFGDDAPLSSFRVLTVRGTDGPRVLRCAIRIGRAGSIVDNTQQGGIWAQVDSETGEIMPGVTKKTYGKRAHGVPIRHGEHPDTGKSFVGLRIPNFEACKELALRAQSLLAPDAPSLGWDLALAEDGPVFLEVNVWATCYDHDPKSDGFTPVCACLIEDLGRMADGKQSV
jgi:hypothetical protein